MTTEKDENGKRQLSCMAFSIRVEDVAFIVATETKGELSKVWKMMQPSMIPNDLSLNLTMVQSVKILPNSMSHQRDVSQRGI